MKRSDLNEKMAVWVRHDGVWQAGSVTSIEDEVNVRLRDTGGVVTVSPRDVREQPPEDPGVQRWQQMNTMADYRRLRQRHAREPFGRVRRSNRG